MSNKQKYRDFCKTEPTIPIFSKDWWLDAVCGEENWNISLVEKGGQIVASMPYYYIQKRYNFTLLAMPALTQTIGPWIKPSQAKYVKQLAEQKDLMNELIANLPPFDYFNQRFHYSITNWLPFYWKGFKQTTRYTYVLENITENKEIIWAQFAENIRTDVRKAQKRVIVRDDLSIEQFLNINEMTFKRQGLSLPFKHEFVKRLDSACLAHESRKMFFTEDAEGLIHAAIYIIWDDNSAYLLMSGGDPKLRNSGANSLLIWEAIQFASSVTKKFDFEGSMIESVERFFRAFGAVQKPYFDIQKTNSKLFLIKRSIIEIINTVLGK
jgi:hypothetical protein